MSVPSLMRGSALGGGSVPSAIQRFIESNNLRIDHRYSSGLVNCCPVLVGGGKAAGRCCAPANRYARTFVNIETSSLPSTAVCKSDATRPQYSYDELVYMIFGQNCSFIRWVNMPSRSRVSGSSCAA